ncbi:putative F-box/LRR-repeat protein 23 [Durio zibethinus]|uniref:F-box/LRR-repeat protein 23 n=1 Tax=Durio zibethinus TaxID=66656 RepID=A0A6P6AI53_DURZI|nr:putative F-box/LRR-repeat protein 23 [Durio zibethinus]
MDGLLDNELSFEHSQPSDATNDIEERIEEQQRNWKDMETDCLINVLGRVGMESLLLYVPFVCKSWHRASLNPMCWKTLIFPKIKDDRFDLDYTFRERLMDTYQIKKFSVTAFIKSIVDRSHGNATTLFLPEGCSEEALKYVADKCSALKQLGLPADIRFEQSLAIQELIEKSKNLEYLLLRSFFNLKEVLAQVSLNCHNLLGLGIFNALIKEDEAMAIVTLLPKITHLFLRGAHMYQENLVTILQGCKQLVHLDVRDCIGFDEDDDEILKLASFITKFKCEGSTLYDYDDYPWPVDNDTDYSD